MTILKADKIDEVRHALERLNAEASTADRLMEGICHLLNEQMLKYNWAGFYMLEAGTTPPVLVLGHFRGAMTPHTRISLNQGICGAAASSGKTVVVDDVKEDPRYLACSLETKSEIVVPVFSRGTVVGELDIDSHTTAAFTDADRSFLEQVAEIVGDFISRADALR